MNSSSIIFFLLLLPVVFPRLATDTTGRVELHVHLDGSISVETLLEVSISRNISIPNIGVPQSIADIWRALDNVTSPWQRFDVVNDIVGGDPETLQMISERFVERQAAQNVVYTEVRYDPVRMAVSNYRGIRITEEQAVYAITAGLRAGADKHGVRVHSLLCAMRGKPASACDAVAELVAKVQSRDMGGVVGLDLAGDETDYNNSKYIQCFRNAKLKLGLNTTVHAGEAVRPEDVRTAVEDMLVDRVGHGYSGVREESVLNLLQARGTHLEACPHDAERHGIIETIEVYKKWGLSFGLNEDDPAAYFENCTMKSSEQIVVDELGFTNSDITLAYKNAMKAAFGPI